jgi:hypothetical protein
LKNSDNFLAFKEFNWCAFNLIVDEMLQYKRQGKKKKTQLINGYLTVQALPSLVPLLEEALYKNMA